MFILNLLFTFLASLSSSSASPAVVASVAHDLSYDENQKLTSHYLLYQESCTALLASFTSPRYQTLLAKDEVAQQLFTDDFSEACQAVCLGRGTDRSLAHHVMPSMHYKGDGADFRPWFQKNCAQVESCFMNYYDRTNPLQLFWINAQGEKQLHMQIEYGEPKTRCFHTYLGHEFVAETVEGNEVAKVTIEYATVLGFGESPPSDDVSAHNFDEEIEYTLREEWKRHKEVSRTFSPLGFKKGQMPRDVFAYMGAFYYNNRHNASREEWKGRGVFVNWWETGVYFIQVPWQMKQMLQIRLLELVEAWAGVQVEQTVMYGLRKYTEGARLLTHVDRRNTHAVSLIVNIAQGNLTEPWPVEVQDHMDRMHEILMEPGDIVYYESAKALHGRNRPMTGPNSYYVNLFTHYRPVEDADDWYKKPNPEGTPEPIMDVDEGCRLVYKGTSVTTDGQLGVVQGVDCKDERLTASRSPTLFQAKSGDDLIEWWRMTDPRNKDKLMGVTDETLHAKVDQLSAMVEKLLEERTSGNKNDEL
jgi:hypothetical protein